MAIAYMDQSVGGTISGVIRLTALINAGEVSVDACVCLET